jgi:hypothetical protein
MDSDLEINGEKTTLKQVLHSRLLLPQECKEKEITRTLLGRKDDSSANMEMAHSDLAPLYSLILFGPPGEP